MLKKEIDSLLQGYLDYYHLSDWKGVVENRSTRRFGACYVTRKLIKISGRLGALNPKFVVSRVIKHEIAHALAGLFHHHDNLWKQICLAIGGDGKTKYSSANTNTLYAKHTIPMETPVVNKITKNKVYSWTNKKGQKITITEHQEKKS